jgi:hypothetical protein
MEEKMKRMMFVALALLFGLTLWIIKVGWAQKSDPRGVGQREQNNWFEINAWGTLKVVRNKKGREIFGPKRPPNEGYSIAYQQLHPETKKPIGTPKVFFAVGDSFSEKQLICEECEERQKRKRDQAVATVTTTDGILQINSTFHFNEKDGKLKIVRIIENISEVPVQLISIRAQYDARLGSKEAMQFAKVKPHESDKPRKIGQTQPGFTPSKSFISGSWTTAATLFHKPCDPCPPYCELELTPSSGEKELICVGCPADGSSILEHMTINLSAGQDPQAVINRWKDKGGCEHSIIVDVWNRQVIVDGKLREDLGTGEIICVDCPKTGGETFVVQPAPILGSVIDTIKNMRDSGKCQLAIYANNGGSYYTDPRRGNANDGYLGPGGHLATIQNLNTQ